MKSGTNEKIILKIFIHVNIKTKHHKNITLNEKYSKCNNNHFLQFRIEHYVYNVNSYGISEDIIKDLTTS